MTTDPERVEEVAKGLTKAQRATIVRQGGSHSEVTDHELDPYWYGIRKLDQGQFGLNLTRLGQAVRAHLLAKEGRS